MKSYYSVLFFMFQVSFLVSVLSITGCKKEKHNDPCVDATSFHAEFIVGEILGDSVFPSLDLLANNPAGFRAGNNYDSVHWTIGSDTRLFTQKKLDIYFNDRVSDVLVSFTAFKKPNLACFPNDKSTETITRTITVHPRDSTAAIVGSFKGFNQSDPSVVFSISILYQGYDWGYFLKNLPKGCEGYTTEDSPVPKNVGQPIYAGYNHFRFNGQGLRQCVPSSGSGEIRGDSLIVEYQYSDVSKTPGPNGYPQIHDKFIGIRQ